MNTYQSATLKSLATRKTKITAQIKGLEIEIRDNRKKLSEAKSKLSAIDKQINKLQNSELHITEHAILRYLQRVIGLDTEMVRSDILEKIKPIVDSLGDGKYPLDNGCEAIVKNNAVISIKKRE